MGFFDQFKKGDPMAARAKAAAGYQPGEHAGLARQLMPQFSQADLDSIAQAGREYDQRALQSMPSVPPPASDSQGEYVPPPLPKEYQDQQNAMVQPGPLQRRYSDAALNGPGEAPHGFLGHLKGAGLGFLLDGLPGAVAGGVAPGIPQRAIFRGVTLPQLASQADQEMQQQGQQRQGYHALAQSTGYDPITHQPTLPMLQAQAMQQYRLGGLDLRSRGLDIQEQRANEATRQHDLTNEYRQARLQQFQQGIQNGQYVAKVGADGNTYLVNKADPNDAAMVTENGREIGSWEESLEKGRNYRTQFVQGQQNQRTQFVQGQQNQRQVTGIAAAGARQDKGIAAGDRRAAKRSGGLLEAARQQMGQGLPAPSASPQSISRSVYNAMVKEKGQARTDAYVKARGLQIQD